MILDCIFKAQPGAAGFHNAAPLRILSSIPGGNGTPIPFGWGLRMACIAWEVTGYFSPFFFP